jgi:hypothetical protein
MQPHIGNVGMLLGDMTQLDVVGFQAINESSFS